ncbi:MAG: DinB family protein [bacterium]|nr:DinB family protein [bacterium]
MPILDPEKALRTLRKNPVILQGLLRDVSQEQAVAATDGPDGWRVLFVVCHLRDFETIFLERARRFLEEDTPHLARVDHEALMTQNDYAGQNLGEAFDEFVQRRRTFINVLEGLTESEWARRGVHPSFGEGSLLDFAINTGLHDLNHIEQIVRALGLSEAFV